MTSTIEYLNSFNDIDESINSIQYNNIKVKYIPSLSVYIMNYKQVENNPNGFRKGHPINTECRNLILKSNPWRIVAQSFKRFLNWGENIESTNKMKELMSKGLVEASEKFDGSLIQVTYIDEWRIFTRGSYADENKFTEGSTDLNDTYGKRVRNYLNLNLLNKDITYVFELCTNKLHITKYDSEFLALLSANSKGIELNIDDIIKSLGGETKYLKVPERFKPKDIEDVYERIKLKSSDFEGYVLSSTIPLYEGSGIFRLKVKSLTYIEKFHFKNEIPSTNDLINIVLKNETDELGAYVTDISKYKSEIDKITNLLNEIIISSDLIYNSNKHLIKKEYAKFISSINHKMSWVLYEIYNLDGKKTSRDIVYDPKYKEKVLKSMKNLN